MPVESENIELRSEEMEDVLGKHPGWIIRWGISVIFAIIVLVLVLSWVVKYPDVIPARAVITTLPNPTSIVAHSSGKIVVLRDDFSKVKEGEVVAYIESPTDVNAAGELYTALQPFIGMPVQSIRSETIDSLLTIAARKNLGEIQLYASDLVKALEDLRNYYQHNSTAQQITSVENQIQYYHVLNNQLSKQIQISQVTNGIARKKLNADSLLMSEKVIAPLEMDNSRRSYLESVSSLENSRFNEMNNQLQITILKAQKDQLSVSLESARSSLLANVRNALQNLNSKIEDWRLRYLVIAPYSGEINFSNQLYNNHFFSAGQELMKVTPSSRNIICKVMVPVAGSGKVETGQSVNIKLDDYPYNEYGMLTGTVKNISLVPIENTYTAVVQLNNGTVTTYRKQLPFRQEMQGNANLVTRDLRFIERIFYEFRKLADTRM